MLASSQSLKADIARFLRELCGQIAMAMSGRPAAGATKYDAEEESVFDLLESVYRLASGPTGQAPAPSAMQSTRTERSRPFGPDHTAATTSFSFGSGTTTFAQCLSIALALHYHHGLQLPAPLTASLVPTWETSFTLLLYLTRQSTSQ